MGKKQTEAFTKDRKGPRRKEKKEKNCQPCLAYVNVCGAQMDSEFSLSFLNYNAAWALQCKASDGNGSRLSIMH